MSKALELTKDTFKKEVLEANIPVLVDFFAPWCGPCQMMAPILDELSAELSDKIKITKLDTNEEKNQELTQKYQVMSIPNMKLFQDGKVVHEIVGFRPKAELKEELVKFMK